MRSVNTLLELARGGERARGWYQRAHGHLRTMATELSVSFDKLCDIVAITSPGVTVRQNLDIARQYITTGAPSGHPYGRNVVASLDHWRATGEIRGPKTSAFARNLRGELDALTLDRWMFRALDVSPQASGRMRPAVEVRREAEKRLRAVARKLGWMPAEVQAAIWHVAQVASGTTDIFSPFWLE